METHDQAVERLVRSRIEQGFPLHVEDPDVLERIAGAITNAHLPVTRKSRPGIRSGPTDTLVTPRRQSRNRDERT